MRLKVFFVDDLEYFVTDRAGNRAAAESAEKFHAIVERRSNFRRGDHRADWMTITNGLAYRHDVRRQPIRLKSPKVSAKPPIACLNLIRDTHTVCSLHRTVNDG